MSSRANAKPIVRRQKVSARQPKILLTVPDLRAETCQQPDPLPEEASSMPPTADIHAISRPAPSAMTHRPEPWEDVQPTAPVAALEPLQVPLAFEQAMAANPDQLLSSPADHREQEIETPRQSDKVAREANTAGPQFGSGLGEQVHIATEVSPSASSATSNTGLPSIQTFDPRVWFSEDVKRNLGIVGTIAAAVVVCTLVARAMKHDHGVRDDTLALNVDGTEELTDLDAVLPEANSQAATGFGVNNSNTGMSGVVQSPTQGAPARGFSDQSAFRQQNQGFGNSVTQGQFSTRGDTGQGQPTNNLAGGQERPNGFPNSFSQPTLSSGGVQPQPPVGSPVQQNQQPGYQQPVNQQPVNQRPVNQRPGYQQQQQQQQAPPQQSGFDPFALPAFSGGQMQPNSQRSPNRTMPATAPVNDNGTNSGNNNLPQFNPGPSNPNMGQSFAGSVEQSQTQHYSTARADATGSNYRNSSQSTEIPAISNFRPFVPDRQGFAPGQSPSQNHSHGTAPTINAANQFNGGGPSLNSARQPNDTNTNATRPMQGQGQSFPTGNTNSGGFPSSPPQLGQPIPPGQFPGQAARGAHQGPDARQGQGIRQNPGFGQASPRPTNAVMQNGPAHFAAPKKTGYPTTGEASFSQMAAELQAPAADQRIQSEQVANQSGNQLNAARSISNANLNSGVLR